MSKKIHFGLVFDAKAFVFETGYTFRGLTVSSKDNQYNCVLRATDKDGVHVYCIHQADDPVEGFDVLWGLVTSKDAKYFWRLDGWA